MTNMPDRRDLIRADHPWSSILILALGICAGMQLGKVAPVIPRLQAEMGLGLSFTGWLTSTLGLFVALFAFPATRFVSHRGASNSMKLGGALLTVGAVGLAFAPDPSLLLLARTIEAGGYVVIVIAAPAYLASNSPRRMRTAIMALWGSFVPLGYALASFQASVLPPTWTASQVLATFAVPIGFLVSAAFLFVPGEARTKTAQRARARASSSGMLIATAFGLYVYLSIGFFTFLPRYLADEPSHHWMPAGAIALFVPVGNATAALLLGFLGAKAAGRLCMVAFVVAALAGAMAFSEAGAGSFAMPLFAFAGGLAASSLFAGVTLRARDEAAATALIGAIAQAGGIATLLGPPLAGHLVESEGWAALSRSFTLVGLLAAGIVACAELRPAGTRA